MRTPIVVKPGDRFGRWTVRREVEPIRNPQVRRQFECRCWCGSVAVVFLTNLRRGLTVSCGCWRQEKAREDNLTHGDTRSIEHMAWTKIKGRCNDRNDKSWFNYGGRGITMFDGWQHDYAAFLAHVGRRPGPGYSIDRIDNDLGYEPGNVRWATRTEQNRNKRNTVFVEYQGHAASAKCCCGPIYYSTSLCPRPRSSAATRSRSGSTVIW